MYEIRMGAIMNLRKYMISYIDSVRHHDFRVIITGLE